MLLDPDGDARHDDAVTILLRSLADEAVLQSDGSARHSLACDRHSSDRRGYGHFDRMSTGGADLHSRCPRLSATDTPSRFKAGKPAVSLRA
ncbi:MAG: hypothetical protein EOO77_06525 [Oxalobacteraceae bacterium]|nr:MAG: hypothetical protein EOO77_06525 [Oxalobacteraceae bacterium]